MARKKIEIELTGNSRSAVRAMDETGNASDGLGSKLGGVGVAAGAAMAAVAAAAVAAGVALYKIGDTFNDATRTIRIGTGATGEDLAGLEDVFRNVVSEVPADFGDASTAVADLNTRLGLTDDQLEESAAQFLNLARITGGDVAAQIDNAADVFNSFGVDAADQGRILDELFRVTQHTGVGFDELAGHMATHGTTLRGVGMGVSESAALFGTLEQAGVNAADVMPGLQRAMNEAMQSGKDPGEELQRVLAGIVDGTGDTEEAFNMFGTRGGGKLIQLAQEGKLEFGELLATIEAGGDTIDGLADETSTAAESWQLLKNNVALALEEPAREIFEAVGEVMAELGPIVAEVAGVLGGHLSQTIERLMPLVELMIPVIADILEIFAEVAGEVMSALIPALGEILDAVMPLLPVIGSLVATFAETLAPILATVVEAIAPVIASLVEGLQPVIESLEPVIAVLGEALGEILEAVLPLVPVFAELLLALMPLIPPIAELIANLVTGLLPILMPLIEMFVEFNMILTEVLVAGIEAVVGVVTGFIDILVDLTSRPGELGEKFRDGMDKVKDAVGRAFDWVGEKIDTVKGWFQSIPGSIGDAFGSLWDTIIGPFRSAFNAVANMWNDTVGSLSFTTPDWVPGIGGRGFSMPQLPTIAAEDGAFLTAPTMLLAAESAKARAGGGEIVSPVAMMRQVVREELRGGGGGTTVNVGGHLYGDAREFGRAVVEAQREYVGAGGV